MNFHRSEPPLEPDEQPKVEMLFRNGTLTAVCILLSFSLTFVTQWAHNPVPWGLADLPTLVLLSLGIVMQVISLKNLLKHDSLERGPFDAATRLFVRGVVATSLGVISAIVVDFFILIAPFTPASTVGLPPETSTIF